MDAWQPQQLKLMECGGNAKCKNFFIEYVRLLRSSQYLLCCTLDTVQLAALLYLLLLPPESLSLLFPVLCVFKTLPSPLCLQFNVCSFRLRYYFAAVSFAGRARSAVLLLLLLLLLPFPLLLLLLLIWNGRHSFFVAGSLGYAS